VATNVSNSVQDFVNGVDTATMEGNDRSFVDGALTVDEGRRYYRALFGVTIALGLVIVAATGPAILPVGVLGVLAAWSYTVGPFPYKYHALGEPTIVFLMGPLMTLGAYTA
jgi:1,4-dihydroxy-2-naphthoate octaprenyltransferase